MCSECGLSPDACCFVGGSLDQGTGLMKLLMIAVYFNRPICLSIDFDPSLVSYLLKTVMHLNKNFITMRQCAMMGIGTTVIVN